MGDDNSSRQIPTSVHSRWCCAARAGHAVLMTLVTASVFAGDALEFGSLASQRDDQLGATGAWVQTGHTPLTSSPELQSRREVVVEQYVPIESFNPVQVGEFEHSILIPSSDVSVKIGGYVKGDFIHDFDAIRDSDRFNVFTIPTDGADGENTRLHARQSRLNVDARRPTPWGELRGFVEGDFFPAFRTELRLRHAFGEVGGLLVGQTWTTLTHIEALPETVDFESPTAFIVTRRGQIRWSHNLTDCLVFSAALEDPVQRLPVIDELPRVTVAGEAREPSPDYVARIRYTREQVQLQFGGTVRQFALQPIGGSINTETGYALVWSGVLNVTEKQTFKFQTEFGEGVGGFRGVLDAVPNNLGGLDVLDIFAATAGYTIQWNDHWRSTAVYAYGSTNNTELQEDDALRAVQYLAVNLFWLPFDGTRIGVEYLYGTREDKDGSMGHANRFQLGVWYDLP